jgi:cyclase
VLGWAKRMAEMGVGEIVITSVDKEGTGTGYDIELTKKIAESVPVPVIAHGGAGKLKHFEEIIKLGHADAIATASAIHYSFIMHNKVELVGKTEGNTEFLESGRHFTRIKEPVSIADIKQYLLNHNISCRP